MQVRVLGKWGNRGHKVRVLGNVKFPLRGRRDILRESGAEDSCSRESEDQVCI